jgi:hypothetical protein
MPTPYYEQGRRDAENGELNQLFYHTYHDYKRGYDETLRGPKRRRIPALLWIVPVLLVGLGLGWLLRDRGVLSAQATPVTIIVTPTRTTPSPTFPPFIIATPAPPTPTSGPTTLQAGAQATVSTDGDALRVRPAPNTQGEPIGRLANGTVVTIVAGPSEGDGYTWWQIENDAIKGWVVADFLRLKR